MKRRGRRRPAQGGTRRGRLAAARPRSASAAALDAICLKALAAQPEDRYASARDLGSDLENWMADEPVSAWREPFSIAPPRFAAAPDARRQHSGRARVRNGRACGLYRGRDGQESNPP